MLPGDGDRELVTPTGAAILAALDELRHGDPGFDPAALRDREALAASDFPQAVCLLGAKLAEALAFAHARGVLHCDIKPGNILLTPYGRPMLADFNVAFARAKHDPASGRYGGTLAYMAPEIGPITVTRMAPSTVAMISTGIPNDGDFSFRSKKNVRVPPCGNSGSSPGRRASAIPVSAYGYSSRLTGPRNASASAGTGSASRYAHEAHTAPPCADENDAGAPPPRLYSGRAHAGHLAIEFSADGQMILCSCGAPEEKSSQEYRHQGDDGDDRGGKSGRMGISNCRAEFAGRKTGRVNWSRCPLNVPTVSPTSRPVRAGPGFSTSTLSGAQCRLRNCPPKPGSAPRMRGSSSWARASQAAASASTSIKGRSTRELYRAK